jgi:large subunit ribosomal protein L7/L12
MVEEQKSPSASDEATEDKEVEPSEAPEERRVAKSPEVPQQRDEGGKEQAKPEDKKPEPSPSAKATEDKKPEPKVKEKVKDEKVEVPAKFKNLVGEIEKMSITDLAELVKILEKKFGVSPMVAPTAVGVPAAGGGPVAEAEEKTEFAIELKDAGAQKIQVIKVVREITGKGLKEAKDIVDAAPKVIKENVKKEEAEEIKDKLEKAGATVELK